MRPQLTLFNNPTKCDNSEQQDTFQLEILFSISAVLAMFLFGAVVQTDLVDFNCPVEDEQSASVYYQNPDDCSTFFECTPDQSVRLLPCPVNEYFDPLIKVCTLAVPTNGCKVLRARFVLAVAVALFSAILFCSETSALPKKTEDSNKAIFDDPIFDCPVETNESLVTFFQNPENCTSFYECGANRVPILIQCPDNLYFDPLLKVCDRERPTSGCEESLDMYYGEEANDKLDGIIRPSLMLQFLSEYSSFKEEKNN
uniref:Chitin-binding type-2 domain-containing protein n=1 Tax=Timema monikensis TaxID=170555 RepID=A0A7R9E032_9NEOP|nr:unnamed protein product [Timema monikensis]